MQISLQKLVPRAVALALVGYWAWPSVDALRSQPKSKSAVKSTELPAALLKAPTSPLPTRNPFENEELIAVAGGAGSEKRGQTGSAAARALKSNELTLDATCILGGRRLAVISGSLYAVHEKVPAESPSAAPYTLSNVLPYKVLLEREGKTTEISYSNIALSAESSKTRATPTMGGTKPSKMTKQKSKSH
jgi:hypothetical protein